MKVKDVINNLQTYPEDMEVVVLMLIGENQWILLLLKMILMNLMKNLFIL